MSLIDVPPGMSMAVAQRRMRRLWLPAPVTADVASASSTLASATVTASGSAHTKGAWSELIAATGQEAIGVDLWIVGTTGANGVDTSSLLDIGIGAAAAEVVKIADVPVGYLTGQSAGGPRPFLGTFPILIPPGSRVAARVQSAVTSKAVVAGVRLRQPDSLKRRAGDLLLTMGTNAAASRGVVATAPGSINTKGAWTEIATTTSPICGLIVGVQGGGDTAFSGSPANFLLDIGIGAAGSEQVVLPDLHGSSDQNEGLSLAQPGVWHLDLPAGTKLHARWAVSSLGMSLDVTMIGVPA